MAGDKLSVTCEFDTSSTDHEVHAGATHNDEMCNMYLMVSTAERRAFDVQHVPDDKRCMACYCRATFA